MNNRYNTNSNSCPVARSVDIVGDRWSLLIVRDVFDGKHRFRDFQCSLGVARNILADRLRRLVEDDVLTVRPASDGTSYQEYILTKKGESLFPLVVALRQWGERFLFEKNEPHSTLIDGKTDEPIALMLPRTAAGKRLTPQNAVVKRISSLRASDLDA